MATVVHGWRVALRQRRPQSLLRTQTRTPCAASRAFTTIPRRADEKAADGTSSATSSDDFASTLSPAAQETYNGLSATEKRRVQVESRKIDANIDKIIAEPVPGGDMRAVRPRPRNATNFLAMGEKDEKTYPAPPEFEEDEMSSLGHGFLEQHREIREFARIAAWEMPLLSKLAQPFVPPAHDQPLRFRYTTYMGETHPAEKKVVVEFCTRDLPGLTESQREKLIKLVGVRYNPETDVVKMSSEMFETQAQNKRYLGDLVDTLLREARDSKDTFADIPFDFRHHTYKTRLSFPEEWRMTPERRQHLLDARAKQALEQETEHEQGKIVDGTAEIARALVAPSSNASKETST
ncbi:MAG: 37S ribosomal protein S24, mitochondrial, partial [Thelocarpon superellum]